MADGSETFLLAPDLATALADATQAHAAGEWTARRVVIGRDSVLEGEELALALRSVRLHG